MPQAAIAAPAVAQPDSAADVPRPVINAIECKACGRCVLACPKKCLVPGKDLNTRGYAPVLYTGGCMGCGNCFYACPEPNCLEVHVP